MCNDDYLRTLDIDPIFNSWRALKPRDALPQSRFEEQLTVVIGQFYAKQPRESEHHLPRFFATIAVNEQST